MTENSAHDEQTAAESEGRKAQRATFWTRAAVVAGLALLGAILYLLVTVSADTNNSSENTEDIVSGIEQQQQTNTDTINTAEETLARVIDCTEPGGECFEAGSKRTAAAVGNIGRLSVYAAACAADPVRQQETLQQRASEIEACVTGLVERDAAASGG
jgi:hypothetical protein